MEAVGRHYGKQGEADTRSGTSPTSRSTCGRSTCTDELASPSLYRSLFLAGYAGLRASGHLSGMKVLMGETSPIGVQRRRDPGSARIHARRAVPRWELPTRSGTARSCRRPATPSTHTRRASGRAGSRARRTRKPMTSRSARSAGSARRSTAPRSAGALTADCRSTSPSSASRATPTRARRPARAAGRVSGDRREDRLEQPARRLLRPVPAA